MSKGFALVSDNPSEPPNPVLDMDWKDLVVGKAVWMWRSLLGA